MRVWEAGPYSLAITHWMERWSRLGAFAGVAAIGLPVAIGLVTGALTDFGRGTDTKFFELVAQVVPVFFLATVVEYFAPGWSARRTPTRTTVVVADVVLAEGLALYAVAAQEATTFLTVACAVALLCQVVDLAVVLASRRTGGVPNVHSEVTLRRDNSGIWVEMPAERWLADQPPAKGSNEPPPASELRRT